MPLGMDHNHHHHHQHGNHLLQVGLLILLVKLLLVVLGYNPMVFPHLVQLKVQKDNRLHEVLLVHMHHHLQEMMHMDYQYPISHQQLFYMVGSYPLLVMAAQ